MKRITIIPTKKEKYPSSSKGSEDVCHRCGTKRHWSRLSRVPLHLCNLYKASLKGKEREINFIDQEPDSTHLNASDFDGDLAHTVVDSAAFTEDF